MNRTYSILLFAGALIGVGLLIFSEVRLTNKNAELAAELAATRVQYASTTDTLQGIIVGLQKSLEETRGENATKDAQLQDTIRLLESVQENLNSEKAKVGTLADQVNTVTSAVSEIQKLSTIDKELLEKYSKVYFLNENYTPKKLVQIDPSYVYDTDKRYWILDQVWPYLLAMLNDARKYGLSLEIISAYRSFYEQDNLKSTYTVTYGSGANAFSADQGYSEHQLGTTVDLTDTATGDTFSGFEDTKTYEWLLDNAYRYGFVESYPMGNNYYVFEPWHWRFVGVALALKLHNDGKYFYDLDQRTINDYLVSIFDTPVIRQ